MSDATTKHNYTSFKADGADPTQVRASNWNEAHVYTGGSDGQVLARDSVSTTGASWIPKTTAGIDVSFYATAGTGASATPWTGWDTAITWMAETEYHFKSGWYSYSTSPNFLKTGIALVGEAGTVLKHTGTGNAVTFDNPGGGSPSQSNWTMNVRFENFIIIGNSGTTNGIFVRGMRDGIFKHLSVREVSNAGIWTEACVTNILENFRVTHWENNAGGTWSTTPVYGIVSAERAIDGGSSTTWTIINPVIELVSGIGIWLKTNCYGNTIINGTAEGNTGKGIVIDSKFNTVINTDFEANTGTDIEVNHDNNQLINCFNDGLTSIVAGHCNRIVGGSHANVTVALIADLTMVEGVYISNTFTDNSTDSIKVGVFNGGTLRYDSYINNYVPRMLNASFITPFLTDCIHSSHISFTPNSNFTLANPTNGVNGQTIMWRIQQDNTGSRIITFDTKFVARSDQAGLPTLHTAANVVDYIRATYDSTRDKWDTYI